VRALSVKGRNLSEGVPRSFTLNSNEILEALICHRYVAANRPQRKAWQQTRNCHDLGARRGARNQLRSIAD
jgi:hypothetical protein